MSETSDPQSSAPDASLRFRPATAADEQFFRKIEFSTTWSSLDPEDRRSLGRSHVEDALEETVAILRARQGNHVIIAENAEGERVGLLWYGCNRNLVTGEEEAWIYNVSVVDDCQGRGYGGQLVRHAEALARKDGYRVLGLMVASHNEPARRLYERLEFQASNFLMRKRLR